LNKSDMQSPKNILVFEPDASGHHPGYLYHLIINFLENNYSYKLIILVSPDFFEKHAQILQKTLSPRVRWLKFSESEFIEWQKPKSVFKRSIFEWKLFCRYAKEHNTILGFFMYIDYLQLAVLSQSPPPCPISGILFRPTLVNYTAFSLKEKLNYWRKNITLKYFVKDKNVVSLFSLDSFARDFIKENWHTDKVKFLPDPVQVYQDRRTVAEVKKILGIKENRKVFLIFGFLDSRKGISDVMEVIATISREKSQKGCLLVVGPWEKNERALFNKQLMKIEKLSGFQIIVNDSFVKDEDIQQYFKVTDYALALYRLHFGMSAIMVRAAAAQKPLITYNFGLMGKIVSENKLGIIINDNNNNNGDNNNNNNGDNNNLKERIEILLENKNFLGDKDKMKDFADLNQAENYAKVILEHFKAISN